MRKQMEKTADEILKLSEDKVVDSYHFDYNLEDGRYVKEILEVGIGSAISQIYDKAKKFGENTYYYENIIRVIFRQELDIENILRMFSR